MAVHLARTGKLNGQRKARFSDQFVDDVVALHTTITKDIVDRYIQVRIVYQLTLFKTQSEVCQTSRVRLVLTTMVRLA